MRAPFLLSLVAASTVVPAAANGPDPSGAAADRGAWRYTEKDSTVTIIHKQGKEWIAERTDGKRPVYDEVARTAEYVELQNRESRLFIRLSADRAWWKRPNDADWTRWVKGGWIEIDPPPGAPPPADAPRSSTPQDNGHRIRLAYFVPRDRQAVADYEAKICVIMSIVAELYREDLRSKGHRTDGLQFETGDDGPVVHLVAGEREAAHYNNAPAYDAVEQWRRVVPEIRAALGGTRDQVIVAFAETYDNGPAEHLWPGALARGAYYSADGGMALYSAHLLRDEFCATTLSAQRRLFFDQTPIRGRKAWGHRMNSPRAEFVEDGIGAVAHELGHALGLPHDLREDDRYLMGNGFRNLRRNFGGPSRQRVGFSDENARLLMSSRYLAGDLDLADNELPRVEAARLSRSGAAFTLAVKASDNTGLRAIVVLDRNAGSVIAGGELDGTSREFQHSLPATIAKSGSPNLQVIVTDNGGHQTRATVD